MRGSEQTIAILPKAKTVWMEENAPSFRYFETEPSWDVFDAEGRFLGRWLDDQDVAHVRKLNLARNARSPGEACR